MVNEKNYQFVAAAKKAVYIRSSDNNLEPDLLIKDLRNIASHVLGEHKNCSTISYLTCEGGQINYVEDMTACGLYEDILVCFQRLIDHASSLMLNMTNNLAEQFNSVICKFVAGKRINFSQRGSYKTRCETAAISFNSGPEYRKLLFTDMAKKSPSGHTKKHIEKLKRRSEMPKTCKKRLFKSKKVALPDEHYGSESAQLIHDLSEEVYCLKEKKFLETLKKSPEEIIRTEEKTRGQANNSLWFKERGHRITASHFKDICSMKKTTSCANKVKQLLYTPFKGNANTRYGRRNETRAISDFENTFGIVVKPCGFFIDQEDYMLGASPDGLVGENACVEIKCPAKAADLHPKDAMMQKIIKYADMVDNQMVLKRNHGYFYQIQGQLHITNRQFCYFVVWTQHGIEIEKIERDDEFWETKMKHQLRNFYFKCLLPEIIDPRKTRGMAIRNPPR
ncbi:hypothetical protein FQR65_LT17771 [Abscondita terminalis]|nr:hypothetical protein FQR65_LT17771 [Abscondita terminalis]